MPLSPAEYQDQLVLEFGEVGDAVFESLVTTWWIIHDDKAQSAGLGLQYLWARREGVLYKLVANADNFDWQEGTVRQDDSDVITNWEKVLKAVDASIAAIQGAYQNVRSYQVGAITKQVIRENPAGAGVIPDANDPAYKGDAYVRTVFPR